MNIAMHRRKLGIALSRLAGILRTVPFLVPFGTSQPAWASPQISAECDTAAELASQKTGVPVAVLRAISLAETGRNSGRSFQPWPWTVNMEGKGEWFDTKEQAEAYANKNFMRGARNFDVGCFQLNYKWHGSAFVSIEQMFDPNANALYAANFLSDLYSEKGNWREAAGAYHSRTPQFANRYMKRFETIYANLPNPALPAAPIPTRQEVRLPNSPEIVVRMNGFPLLQGGSTVMASLGSLMPDSAGVGAQRLIGGD